MTIFYGKNYLSFIAATQKTKINCFKYKKNGHLAVFPHILRGNTAYSLRYGGVYTNCLNKRFADSVKKGLMAYCKRNGINYLRIRNNPFIDTIRIGKVIKKEPFVFVDLEKSESELKNEISKRHIKCIKKASSEQLSIKHSKRSVYLRIFYRMYKNILMKKGVAVPSFSHFNDMWKYLKKDMNIACVYDGQDIVAISLLLKDKNDIYMVYGGMNDIGYKKYAKHFMLYNLILEYKEAGYKRLVLGTGSQGIDSIYRFKQGFSKNSKHYICTYEKTI